MWPAITIALIAAVPGTAAAIIQYKNRSMNPKENGVDWVVHRYREMIEEAETREAETRAELAVEKARADRLADELAVLRSLMPPDFPHEGTTP